MRIPRLFERFMEWARPTPTSSSEPTPITDALKRIEKKGKGDVQVLGLENLPPSMRNDPKILEFLDMVEKSIERRAETNEGVGELNIARDAARIQIDLASCGYEPFDVLLLLGRIYGCLAASIPVNSTTDENGVAINVEEVEKKFFELCTKERIAVEVASQRLNNVFPIDRHKVN